MKAGLWALGIGLTAIGGLKFFRHRSAKSFIKARDEMRQEAREALKQMRKARKPRF